MELKNLFKKSNTIDKLKIIELQEEELRLKSRINRLRKEIDVIEKDKKCLFNEGIGADLIKKKMIAQELKQLDMSGKLKIKNFLTLHKQYMFVSNLIIIKKYQRDLQTTQVWNKIQSLSPENFESSLIKVNLSGKGFENVLDDLNRIFALDITDSDSDVDEAEKQMFDIWNSVEAGNLDVSDAENLISIEKEIEKSLEKGD
ncbi:MAG: chromosome assembly protein [Candidatus Cloacimonetes bacterium]|nr:chromosome assembly protein [Candidatus Cloacimonadota bacterium]